jgi:hypothetical protein
MIIERSRHPVTDITMDKLWVLACDFETASIHLAYHNITPNKRSSVIKYQQKAMPLVIFT